MKNKRISISHKRRESNIYYSEYKHEDMKNMCKTFPKIYF